MSRLCALAAALGWREKTKQTASQRNVRRQALARGSAGGRVGRHHRQRRGL